jgi:hypothetical protein
MDLVAHGRAAHAGAAAEGGVSAIHALIDCVEAIEVAVTAAECALHLVRIGSGESRNTIPAKPLLTSICALPVPTRPLPYCGVLVASPTRSPLAPRPPQRSAVATNATLLSPPSPALHCATATRPAPGRWARQRQLPASRRRIGCQPYPLPAVCPPLMASGRAAVESTHLRSGSRATPSLPRLPRWPLCS